MFRLCCVLFFLECGSLVATLDGSNEWRQIPQLANLPAADEEGIVLDARTVSCPGNGVAYNCSFEKKDGYFLLATRQDVPGSGWPIPQAYISLWKLDSQFDVVEHVGTLRLIDEHSEDPRLFYVGNSLYLSFTHVYEPVGDWKTEVALAKLDLEAKTPLFVHRLTPQGISTREKNWVPFTISENHGKDELYLVYSFNPLRIIKVIDEEIGDAVFCYQGTTLPELSCWERKFGIIRGGTPAIRLENGEYLTLFHSSQGGSSYVMGALCLGINPFRITKISPYPILFRGMYDPWLGYGKGTVIFPGGLVEDTDPNGNTVLRVACGVNDSSVKIVTLDKNLLLKSLISVF